MYPEKAVINVIKVVFQIGLPALNSSVVLVVVIFGSGDVFFRISLPNEVWIIAVLSVCEFLQ